MKTLVLIQDIKGNQCLQEELTGRSAKTFNCTTKTVFQIYVITQNSVNIARLVTVAECFIDDHSYSREEA